MTARDDGSFALRMQAIPVLLQCSRLVYLEVILLLMC